MGQAENGTKNRNAGVYVFLAEGFELVEALMPVDMLRRADIPVQTVSITASRQVTSSNKVSVEADLALAEADFALAEALVLPGGLPGTTNLGACPLLVEKLKEFAADPSKKVAAICAAPSVLGQNGLLAGKRAICYPGWEDKLEGAVVQPGAKAVVDGNIITSRGMGTAMEFSLALITELAGGEAAARVASAVQFG